MSESITIPEQTLYLPIPTPVTAVRMLTKTECLITVELDPDRIEPYRPGQFFMLSLPGIGEAPISVCSPPEAYPRLQLCVRRVGKVTAHLHQLAVGSTIGIRGPMGNGVPLEQLKGQDLLIAAGGLGMVPLHALINHIVKNRADYGTVTVLYGAKEPGELLFRDELLQWGSRGDLNLHIAVNIADEDWMGHVGMITTLFQYVSVDVAKTAAVIVGPPVMYHFVMQEIRKLNLPPERIFLSLERRMKCGVGKCGHCQINEITVCQDGPVFSYDQLKTLPEAI